MSRWFRFYDDAVNDPKLLRLPDDLYRAWTMLLCFASKNEGVLPPADDIAVALRIKPSKVCEWITKLVKGGLIDDIGNGFAPHNWNGRQYKSDVSTERVKRFRNAKRNVSETASETAPETEQIQKQISEANASGAEAPIDHRKRLFNEGLETLARLTGKGPDACRSFVGKCLKAASDDAITVLGLIEDADRNRVVDPSAWIAARLKTGPPVATKPLTEFQRKQAETNDVRANLREIADSLGRGGKADRLVSLDHGQRPEYVRGGTGSNLLALPRAFGGGGDRSGNGTAVAARLPADDETGQGIP